MVGYNMTEEKRVIESQDNRPCGCVLVNYSDGGKLYSPCIPCGLYATAENLSQASQALASVASRMQQNKTANNVVKP